MERTERQINFILNGEKRTALVDFRKTLLEFIREDMQLTGAKKGCGVGECGACTMLVDGEPIDSCIYLAVWADNKELTTIEGIQSNDGSLSVVQQKFVDCGAVQCGFCTPGLVLSATVLLKKNPKPSRIEIRKELSGNLCRCTGYKKIVDAVEQASTII